MVTNMARTRGKSTYRGESSTQIEETEVDVVEEHDSRACY